MSEPGAILQGSPPPPHRLITIQEAARLLACSQMTIRRKIDERCFPAVKIGSKVVVPRAFIEGLINQAEAGATVVVEERARQWALDTEMAQPSITRGVA